MHGVKQTSVRKVCTGPEVAPPAGLTQAPWTQEGPRPGPAHAHPCGRPVHVRCTWLQCAQRGWERLSHPCHVWTLRAMGSGEMGVALGLSFPDADMRLHLPPQ